MPSQRHGLSFPSLQSFYNPQLYGSFQVLLFSRRPLPPFLLILRFILMMSLYISNIGELQARRKVPYVRLPCLQARTENPYQEEQARCHPLRRRPYNDRLRH